MVSSVVNSYARRIWKQADANRWQVAFIAYHKPNRPARLTLAADIEKDESTIDNLISAYLLFRTLVARAWACGKSSEPVRKLRRKFPYTRWSIVYKMWIQYEFDIDEAAEWLKDFDGGNDAMAAEITNKYGAPEWERRACKLYREAGKLIEDISTPPRLGRAAKYYMKIFDAEFPKVSK